MDESYQVYCLANPCFYDSPTTSRGDDTDFARALAPLPPGWRRDELDDWLVYRPVGATSLASQGWKIHASACLGNADAVLDEVFGYCVTRGIPFKFIRSRQLLLLRNGKYAERGASGKFVTIYPTGEDQFRCILEELGALLDGQPGPYILSDLRWGSGPLFVRYGGFMGRYCLDAAGSVVAAIEQPDGTLVPDLRRPTFSVPAWVTLPPFLEPHLAARKAVKADAMPYEIQRALHFSNGGGLYVGAHPRTGEKVVIKEARPHAGLATDGSDAVLRLQRERDTLQRLTGLGVAPGLLEYFTLGEHHFVAMEFVEATPLRSAIVRKYPMLLPDAPAAERDAYVAWALELQDRVEAAVEAVHRRGVVLGDMHPFNILLRPDGRIALIDFEMASLDRDDVRPALANPGFLARPGLTGADVDRYALACLRLFWFLPLTTLFAIDRSKAADLADDIEELFAVPRRFLDEAVAMITGVQPGHQGSVRLRDHLPIEPDPARWPALRDSMTRAILASATPERDDRLFPGDIKQFATGGGLNLAYGAAGVLYALAQTGAGTFPDFEAWLVRHARSPEAGIRFGLYDGLHGVAYALERLGRLDDALDVLDICRSATRGSLDHFGMDLVGGLAGIGLNLGHFATVTGDTTLAAEALAVAQRVADRLGAADDGSDVSGGGHPWAGLTRGASGPALLFVRLYERFGDATFLDLAATALRQDLRRCKRRPEGTLEVNEGWRTMPYLADGGVGIGFVLDDYRAHRHDDEFADAADAIRRTAAGPFTVEPGLFYGKAGMILYLSRQLAPGTALHNPVVAGHVRHLRWHAMAFQGHLAFPGEELLRLSMDLASGTAGVLLAVGAAFGGRRATLPFLEASGQLCAATDVRAAPTPAVAGLSVEGR